MNAMHTPAVEMLGISKKFGGISALSHAGFSAHAGEIHALMGENGAGKSTLMKILAGAYVRDTGTVSLNGEPVEIRKPGDALKLGISIIYQEFALAAHLSVAENICIDDLGKSRGFVQWAAMRKKARAILDELGFSDIDVRQSVGSLPVAYQQAVEICKALSRNSSVLVFDEPTAVLTSHEAEKLFKILEELRRKGVCIVYVSHRMDEIFRICDRATVLKDGQTVGTLALADITERGLIEMMIGRELSDLFPSRNARIGEVLLEVERLCAGRLVRDVSFNLRAGEVLGFCGLVGAGRTETMRAIFGADRKTSGTVRLNGRELQNRTPREAIANGIGLLPEDRKQQGVLLEMSIRVNGALRPASPYSGRMGWIASSREIQGIEALSKQLSVKTRSIEQLVGDLSGGNQQKVALMKWVDAGSRVLILDEPTRGVDVGAKTEIYRVINDLAEQGVAIIMVSSEMMEVIGMCDRVVVMREGAVAGELAGERIKEQEMICLAMGVEHHE
ncbi:sugar ABC transporter ATP-binding protein [Pseudomonas lurida]|uniref:sugar ABC transporter ATP-binding protein n=1 Tax=Pseudomonas lurida TaxID=244566 RepID=UPI001F358C64|nr:sugar ABC transporter ATP-binding protein [Pseudomonas lurida]MCF5025009.1 ATP-binding cassette domain-containing protein [Pseudomonas lurida]MCF5308186.1 ATP-binding cassette domain-containing protein [Pseudomonas lurida]MCF5325931.1 ATP-binding cassette domain-containing protein [Pseudomonas lurida]